MIKNHELGSRLITALLGGLLVLCLFAYWRLGFYYYLLDEVTMLHQFHSVGWSSIWLAQNEHFAPFFKIIFFTYSKLFGNACQLWWELNLFVHCLAVLASFALSYILVKDFKISSLFAVFFGFCPLMWETMYMQSGLGTTSSVFTWLLTLILFFKAQEEGKKIIIVAAFLSLFFQSFTFGNNLFHPILILALLAIAKFRWKILSLIAALILQGINVYVFINFGSFSNNRNFVGTNSMDIDLLQRMVTYFFVSFYGNLGRAVLGMEPPRLTSLIVPELFIVALIVFVSSLCVAIFRPKFRVPILIGWLNYGLLVSLISISRYRLPYEQSFSSRYIYLMMPSFLLILVPTLSYIASRWPKAVPLLFIAIITRYTLTYPELQKERKKAEQLHVRNYQLIVYAKDHPGVTITDPLSTAFMPTDQVVKLLNDLESEKRIAIDHRIPEGLKRPPRELKVRLKFPPES